MVFLSKEITIQKYHAYVELFKFLKLLSRERKSITTQEITLLQKIMEKEIKKLRKGKIK